MKKKRIVLIALVLVVTALSLTLVACSASNIETSPVEAVFYVEGSEYARVELESFSIPAEPKKEGYTFDGWYTDAELSVLFSETTFSFQTLNENLSLYAKFTPIGSSEEPGNDSANDLSVTFYVDGEVYRTIALDSFVLPAEPEKEGYVFDGWYTDVALTTLFSATALSIQTATQNNISLYAKFSPKTTSGENDSSNPDDPSSSTDPVKPVSVKFQKVTPSQFSNAETFRMVYPLISRVSSAFHWYISWDDAYNAFDEIAETWLKPVGITKEDIKEITDLIALLLDAYLEDCLIDAFDNTDSYDVLIEKYITTQNVTKTFDVFRDILGILDANKLIALMECLQRDYVIGIGVDDDYYIAGGYVERSELVSLFAENGIVSFDRLALTFEKLFTDDAAIAFDMLLCAVKRALSFDPDALTTSIKTALKLAYLVPRYGTRVTQFVSCAEIVTMLHTLGEMISYGLTNMDAQIYHAIVKPALALTGFDSFGEGHYFLLFDLFYSQTEIWSSPDLLGAVAKILSSMTEKDLKVVLKYYESGIGFFSNAAYKDVVSLINFLGKSLNSLLAEVPDSAFYEGVFARFAETKYYGSSALIKTDLLKGVANVAEKLTIAQLSELYMNYDDAKKNSDDPVKYGCFVASVMNIIGEEFLKLSPETKEAINKFAIDLSWQNIDWCGEIEKMIKLAGSDYTTLSDEVLTEIRNMAYKIHNAPFDAIVEEPHNWNEFIRSQHRKLGYLSLTLKEDPTKADIMTALDTFYSGGFFSLKSESDFTFEIKKDIDGIRRLVIKGTAEYNKDRFVTFVLSDPERLNITPLYGRCSSISFALNGEKTDLVKALKAQLMSAIIVYDKFTDRYVNFDLNYGDGRWVEDDVYGYRYDWVRSANFYIKDAEVDLSHTGLNVGVATIVTAFGETEMSFICRVYDPENLS